MRHLESAIQIQCVRWFRSQFPRLARNLIAIPNGGARKPIEGKIMKAEGVVAGASDLFLFYPSKGYHGLAIEMKTPQGRQQLSQKLWQMCIERVGYKYSLCRSFEDFCNEIQLYLTSN